MNILDRHVSTRYGDYKGSIQIDFHSGTELFQLCKDNGIDTEKYFVMGFGLSESTTQGIGRSDEVGITLLLADKSQYGNSFDEIEKKVSDNGGKIELIKKRVYLPYTYLGRYIKRYEFLAINHMRDKIHSLEIKEEE